MPRTPKVRYVVELEPDLAEDLEAMVSQLEMTRADVIREAIREKYDREMSPKTT